MLGGQCYKHIVRGGSAQTIFRLLPEEGEFQQFREIGTDECRTRDDSAGDIRPVGPIQAVGRGCGLRTHTGGEGRLIASGMTSQNKVEGVPDDLFVGLPRECLIQILVAEGK